MSINVTNKYGVVSIADEVIATIAGLSAIECFGIVGMAAKNVKDGIFQLLKKESLTKGIKIYGDGKSVTIELHIIVLYGTNIEAIGDTLMDAIKYNVENSTGVKVDAINVLVEGVKIDRTI